MPSEERDSNLSGFPCFKTKHLQPKGLRWASHLVFKAKPNAHSMCAQESSLHTYCIKNGYRITNATIYSIYYWIISLQKTKSNTLESIAVERHHNSTGNWSIGITHLEHHIDVLQIFFSFGAADLCGRGKIARLSTLMLGTQQVQEINNMQRVIIR
jgi:hypothetical protein